MKRVVVTGIGTINPCGSSSEESWKKVCEGSTAVTAITGFDSSSLPVNIAAEIKDFDPNEFIDKKQQRRMDRFTQFAMVASEEALTQSGLKFPLGRRAGVYVGTGIGGIREIEEGLHRLNEKGYRSLGAMFIPKSLANLSGGHIAMKFGATGLNICISTACAAGNHSIGEAFFAIQCNRADIMIAGGAESAINEIGMGGFAVMKALSRRNDCPERASRPFDSQRDGFVMGEGAGILVLESLDHAQSRGATILAEIVGYAQNNDAHHLSSPLPRHEGAHECMKMALESASLVPEQIDYINAHGTSTPSNDVNESQAIEDLFGDHPVLVSSTKGATGHLLGAAGGVEAVFCVQSLLHNIVPPSINIETIDPEVKVNIVVNLPKKAELGYVLSNAFGFGGTNACVIFKRWE